MSTEETIVAGVAGRYATALFELALEVEGAVGGDASLAAFAQEFGGSTLDGVASDLSDIGSMLEQSDDLRRLVRSPVFSREDQSKAIAAVMEKAGIKTLTRNFVALVASNRRLFALEDMIGAYRTLLSRHRGEINATVTSATALNDGHIAALKASLKDQLGQDVQLRTQVDEELIGGLVVKVGSRMIDSSLKTKLSNLKIAMKEVG